VGALVRARRGWDDRSTHSASLGDTASVATVATPGAVTATDVPTASVDLSWTKLVPEPDWIDVYGRPATLGGTYAVIATVAGSATSYSDVAPTNDAENYYKLKAKRNGGVSAFGAAGHVVHSST
jgi:hypothetical protein